MDTKISKKTACATPVSYTHLDVYKRQIMNCVTTDEAFDLIKDMSYYEAVKNRILEKVLYHLRFRLKGAAEIEIVMFTSDVYKRQGLESSLR